MARLELSLLGPMAARLDGRLLAHHLYAKARALLAYLAIEDGRAHQRDALAALLWPDHAPAQARLNLRKALSQLRAALGGDGLLDADRDTIRLAPGAYASDAARFAAACADPAAAGQALALYRGPLLDDLAIGDSVSFTEWQLVQRERLHRLATDACAAQRRAAEAAGRWEEARRAAERGLELEPWDESAHRAAMRALARLGQRAAALQQFARCRATLAAELEVEPEPATLALYESIRAGQLGPVAAQAPSAAAVAPPDNLPTPATPLVGRHAEVAGLAAALAAAEARLITLTGVAGVGKTRLAIAAAAAARPAFDGLWLVPLAPLSDPAEVAPAVLATLGLAPGPAPVDELVAALRGRRALLVLDNCEHLPAAMPLVSALLAGCPTLTLLCTSRSPLRRYGEWVFPVLPLGLPAGDPPHGAAAALASDAVQLFAARARAARHDFVVAEANAPVVAAICARLDGLPLAIELAAARLRQVSPEALLARLDDQLDLLVGGPCDVHARHRSLRAALAWSYRLLTPSQQELFRRLGSIAGEFSRAGARAAAGAPARANPQQLDADLDALLDHSLLQARPPAGEPHYGMLTSLRAFAREQARAAR